MALDCKLSTASAIKGHFCSLLISNILCYPRFRNLPFASLHIQLHTTSFSLVRIPLCIRAIAKGEFAGVFDPSKACALSTRFLNLLSFNHNLYDAYHRRVFHLVHNNRSIAPVLLGSVLTLPLDLSSFAPIV
jgi:hypothetical protein